MYARIATVQIQPGKMDRMINEYEKYWATMDRKGLLGGRQLVDRAANKLVSITIWETLADLEASDRQYQEQAPAYATIFLAPPVREVYEVSAELHPAREREVGGGDR